MAKRTWADFVWPDWVPEMIRAQVEGFWDDKYGRGPDEWERNSRADYNHAPAFGDVVTLWRLASHDQCETGRYVHAWNNIGRLVRDDGSVAYVSCQATPCTAV